MFSTAEKDTTRRKSRPDKGITRAGKKVQLKLKVGASYDKYEQEADAMADKVMSMPAPKSSSRGIQLKCDACKQEEAQTKPLASLITPLVQRQEEEKEEPAQAKLIQKQEEEKEEPQAKLLQRQEEDLPAEASAKAGKEEPQAKLIQKQEEEKEEPQAKLIQKQEEEKEEPQAKLIQRQEEEKEEPAQAKLIQKQEEEKEEPQAKLIQKQEEEKEEPVQAKLIQKQEEEEEPQTKLIQRKGNQETETGSSLESSLNASKGGGSPLPEDTRGFMESRFGSDFSGVKVHTDNQAVQMNKELNSQAFAHGSDIYFNQGKYDPGSSSGKHLMAHELTHVVQQGNKLRRKKKRIFKKGKRCKPCSNPPNPNVSVKIQPILKFQNLGIGHFGTTKWKMAKIHSVSLSHREQRNCKVCKPNNLASFDLCVKKAVILATVPVLLNYREITAGNAKKGWMYIDCANVLNISRLIPAKAKKNMGRPRRLTLPMVRSHELYHVAVGVRLLTQRLKMRNDNKILCPYNSTKIKLWKKVISQLWQNDANKYLKRNPQEPNEEVNGRNHMCS